MRIRTAHLAILVLALVATGCSFLNNGNVFELAVGDCFDDSSSTETELSDVPVVDCAEPHDNEVFFTFEMADGDFPGDQAILDEAESRCLPAFEDYVDRDYATSELDIFPITPTAGSWGNGDREVICALYDLDLDKLTGSMQGSGV